MINLFSFMFFLTELGKSALWKCEPYKSKLDIIKKVCQLSLYQSQVILSPFWVQILNILHWHTCSSRRTVHLFNKYRSSNKSFNKGSILTQFHCPMSFSLDLFGPNNRSCVVISEKDGILQWIFKDCKQRNYFACSKPEGKIIDFILNALEL